MSLDPRLLRSFVILAEELHFSRAAERLHMSQPALSQQIRRLELQLGLEMFERTRSSVRLSEGGRAILGPARTAVNAVESVEEVAGAVARGERGELRLGFSPGVHYVAQAILAEAGRRLPAVRTRARQDSSGALAREVAGGELELALGFCAEPRTGIVCERLFEEPAVLAVGTGHRLASRRRPVRLDELRHETFALVDPHDGPGYNRAVVARCRDAGFEPRVVADPHGPMAWETAVRLDGRVGLTTRSAAASTARDLRLLDLGDEVVFPLQLVRPSFPLASLKPVARAFRTVAREVAAAGAPAAARTAEQRARDSMH
jgi:DNA-binding transcriptional LysR family regulator